MLIRKKIKTKGMATNFPFWGIALKITIDINGPSYTGWHNSKSLGSLKKLAIQPPKNDHPRIIAGMQSIVLRKVPSFEVSIFSSPAQIRPKPPAETKKMIPYTIKILCVKNQSLKNPWLLNFRVRLVWKLILHFWFIILRSNALVLFIKWYWNSAWGYSAAVSSTT